MARTNWYQDNRERDYPFTTDVDLGTVVVPNDLVVDAGITIGPRGPVNAAVPVILYQVVIGAGVQLIFRVDPSSAACYDLQTETIAADTAFGTVIPLTPVIGSISDYGSGFVVIGNLAATLAVGAGTYTTASLTAGRIEPALVQVEAGNKLLTVNYANDPEITYLVSESYDPAATPSAFPVLSGVTSVLAMLEGYNFRIGVILDDKGRITGFRWGALLGVGKTPLCEYLPRTPGHVEPEFQPPDDCWCADVIYSFNGVTPTKEGTFLFLGGYGIEVVAEEHKVIVRLAENTATRIC